MLGIAQSAAFVGVDAHPIQVDFSLSFKLSKILCMWPAMSKRNASNGGERGIRTPGTFRLNSFQDYRIRPLCHLSKLYILCLEVSFFTARRF